MGNNWKEALVHFFEEGEKEKNKKNLGVEVEHFIIRADDKTAVPYSGDKGVRLILEKLMAHYPNAQAIEDDDFFGFSVPEFNITLEPAAQLEISILATEDIELIGKIYNDFYEKLEGILKEYGYIALNAGCQPVSNVNDLELIPKRRYRLMDAHFLESGTGGREMMRGSASTQVSIDYLSEEDFRRKIRAAYYYGPFFRLLLDNSTSFQGERVTTHLKRTDIWRRVDNDRCGILPGVFDESYGFSDYADFIGNMKPIFLKRGHEVIPTGEQTVKEIFNGKSLDEVDLNHILSMAFPDVRLKHFLEIRFADSVQAEFIKAYCALVKGLICSEEGIESAGECIRKEGVTEQSLIKAEDELMRNGWDAVVYGKNVREKIEELMDLARRNLSDKDGLYLTAFNNVIRYGGITNMIAGI